MGPLLVKRFVANGDSVVATDANAGALERLRDNLSHPGKLITETADISSEEDCRRLAESAGQLGGHVNVLMNCAGFFPITPFEAISVEDWHKVLDINLTGSLLTARAFLPLMKNNGGGRIVNFGSGSVFDGPKSQARYVAAKAGIVGFSRSLAREVGGDGITVKRHRPRTDGHQGSPRSLPSGGPTDPA